MFKKQTGLTSYEPAPFTLTSMALLDSSPKRAYETKERTLSGIVSWGQRKLLMSEINFFNYYYSPTVHPNALVVYIGAARGDHIPVLSDFFPELSFLLYDPSDFAPSVKRHAKIEVKREFFGIDTARYIRSQNSNRAIFFISDIRTTDKADNKPGPQNILLDNQLQWESIEALMPVQSLLKFRLPYPDQWETYMENNPSEHQPPLTEISTSYEYLKGKIFLQPWAPCRSTETRLVPDIVNGRFVTTIYEANDFQNRMFYHNMIVRETGFFYDPRLNPGAFYGPELLNDWDSTSEVFTLLDYLEKTDPGIKGAPRTKIVNAINALSSYITNNIQPEGAEPVTISDVRRSLHRSIKLIRVKE